MKYVVRVHGVKIYESDSDLIAHEWARLSKAQYAPSPVCVSPEIEPFDLQASADICKGILATLAINPEADVIDSENALFTHLQGMDIEWAQEGSEFYDWGLKATTEERATEALRRIQQML